MFYTLLHPSEFSVIANSTRKLPLAKAVIFDLDGTLIDSTPIIGKVLNSMREENSLPTLPLDNYRNWISLGAIDLVEKATVGIIGNLDDLLAEFRRRYWLIPTSVESLYSGADWVIKELASHDIKLAICSNKPEHLCKKVLDEIQLLDYFHSVVGGDTATKSKPHREPIDFALRELEAKFGSALFVGDSVVDQNAAREGRPTPLSFFFREVIMTGLMKDKRFL